MVFRYNIQNNGIKYNQIKESMLYGQQLTNTGSWTYIVKTGDIYFTDGIYRIFGSNRQEDLLNIKAYIHEDDVALVERAAKGAMEGKCYDIEYRIINAERKLKYLHEKTVILFDKNKKPIKIIGTIQDITEEGKLRDNITARHEQPDMIQRRNEVMIRESCDVFKVIDLDGTITYTSEASERVIGYAPEECMGKSVYTFYSEENKKKLSGMVEFVVKDPDIKAQGDFVFTKKDGREIYLEVILQNLLDDSAVGGIVISFRDVTKRVEMEKKITYISTHDELTGLPNRIHLKETLKRDCMQAKGKNLKFAVIMLDVDRFTRIIDTIGYYVGDKLIEEVVNRLKRLLGEEHYICRYSEDKFVIILRNIGSISGYELLVKQIMYLFKDTFTIDKYDIDVSAGMGICFYDDKNKEADMLVKHTEIALFWAKNEGRNKYKFYSSDIDIQTYKQFELHSDMINAIDNDQFRVYYQPIVDLKTNRIISAEALIRWEHPSWGMVSPGEFIPIAEETGYIMNIGKWVFKRVCEDYKRWKEDCLPNVNVAVNISGMQFFETDFVENIKNTIDEYGLNPEFLIMEITESILLVNTEKVLNDLKRLRTFGIRIALDDFGTGYSSLAYLSSFNIDILKLDSSFIKNINADTANDTIIKYVINMAQELKLKVVAEGIETMPQLTYLRELNCALGQGYIYSKPLTEEKFERVLSVNIIAPDIKREVSVPDTNRREYFRVNFANLLVADMTILELKGRKMNVGNTKVLVKNISAGGLCFVSDLKMPVDKNLIMQFTSVLMSTRLNVKGYIVWSKEQASNLYEYGVQFVIDERERTKLLKFLGVIQIKLKKEKVLSDGNFALTPASAYFK